MPDFPIGKVDLFLISPQLLLVMWACCVLAFRGRSAARIALIGTLLASFSLFRSWGHVGTGFLEMVSKDSFSDFFGSLILISAVITILMSIRYLEVEGETAPEYYSLLLFAAAGMMFMAGAVDLVTLFVGLELMSISIYILVGFLRANPKSNEASLKYFLLGAFSTGIILYGMSLLYGLAGSTNLDVIASRIGSVENEALLVLSMLALASGLCFKIAAAPFHMWAPDAYEGAPAAITGFMSVAVKAASFAIFFRIFHVAFAEAREYYVVGLVLIAMLTMTWGNVAAVTQSNVKRLLAYSSISHAGYVMMGLVVGTEAGIEASSIYLLAYVFMNLGIWGVIILLRRGDVVGDKVEDFNGLFAKQPWVAVLVLLVLLSLAGIPPLAGFIAKYFVFAVVIQAALDGGPLSQLMILLAIVGALNAVISLYYYMRLVVAMFMESETVAAQPLNFSPGLIVALSITGIFTIWIGVDPQRFIDWAQTTSLPF